MVAVMLKSFTIFWEVDFFFTSMAALPCVSELKSCFVVYNYNYFQFARFYVITVQTFFSTIGIGTCTDSIGQIEEILQSEFPRRLVRDLYTNYRSLV